MNTHFVPLISLVVVTGFSLLNGGSAIASEAQLEIQGFVSIHQQSDKVQTELSQFEPPNPGEGSCSNNGCPGGGPGGWR